ncbi:MAG: hypothetical protein ACO1OB_06120 [Archangium sp.]
MSDLNSEANSLIHRARLADVTPPPSTKKRMRAALVAGLALPAAGATLAKFLIVGVVAAAAGSGATFIATRSTEPRVVVVHTPAPPPVVIVAPSPSETVEAPPPAPLVLPRAKPETPPQQKPEESAVVNLDVQLPPAPTPMTPDESLAAELEAMGVILGEVEASRFDDAFTTLQVFHSRFPKAELQVEADSLEVRVLCGLHREEQARTLAAQLVAKHPTNPSVQRIRNVCAAK